ncbi:hypothetical protein Dimus_038252 [Dionaea muscipula]
MTKLLGFQYTIQYKKGTENVAVDALSRRFSEEYMAVTTVIPQWIDEVETSYAQDPMAGKIRSLFKSKDSPRRRNLALYSIQDGTIRYKRQLYVGNIGQLRKQILTSYRDSAEGGHGGEQSTWRRIKRSFYWPRLKVDVVKYVKECDTCQRTKAPTQSYVGLLQPLAIPKQAWKDVSMGFIEGVSRSDGKECILVVVDRFTKYTHFMALSHPFTAPRVAQLFLDHVVRLHGIPKRMVSDRDKIFTSLFWQELFRLYGAKLNLYTAYHPQSDGQTERVNRCVKDYLRAMILQGPKKWSTWLAIAEWCYNTNYHHSIQMTPFEALYEYPPPQSHLNNELNTSVAAVEELATTREKLNKTPRENIQLAQERQKHYFDKGRTEKSFKEGEFMFLKLQPYRQTSPALRKNLKLAARCYGPYKILVAVGPVAYKLELPSSVVIHHVFHVSLLKRKVGESVAPMLDPPLMNNEGSLVIQPSSVLDTQIIRR